MKSNYKRLGNYIRQVDVRNSDLAVNNLLGLSVNKTFIKSIANTIGTDMSPYKVVRKGQFVYIPDTSRRGDKIAIALLTVYEAIVSAIYTVFEVVDAESLCPDYLMMWFRRPEFDRYARFKSHGSAREVFDWEEMCDVYLPVPSIEEQRRIVSEYKAIENRIDNNRKLIANLEATAQAIYKKMFVDDVDLDNLPKGWRVGKLEEVADYVVLKEDIKAPYISTENMLKDKKGIVLSDVITAEGRGTAFLKDDILISNIRPYFKKLWRAAFNGVCSNDVLVIRVNSKYNSCFLYYSIESDSFFDYVMAGSNGVKMPRGDKTWIMRYEIIIPSEEILLSFDKYVNEIDKMKELLAQENDSLTTLLSFLCINLSKQ